MGCSIRPTCFVSLSMSRKMRAKIGRTFSTGCDPLPSCFSLHFPSFLQLAHEESSLKITSLEASSISNPLHFPAYCFYPTPSPNFCLWPTSYFLKIEVIEPDPQLPAIAPPSLAPTPFLSSHPQRMLPIPRSEFLFWIPAPPALSLWSLTPPLPHILNPSLNLNPSHLHLNTLKSL